MLNVTYSPGSSHVDVTKGNVVLRQASHYLPIVIPPHFILTCHRVQRTPGPTAHHDTTILVLNLEVASNPSLLQTEDKFYQLVSIFCGIKDARLVSSRLFYWDNKLIKRCKNPPFFTSVTEQVGIAVEM
jgi:hypothetical protein